MIQFNDDTPNLDRDHQIQIGDVYYASMSLLEEELIAVEPSRRVRPYIVVLKEYPYIYVFLKIRFQIQKL